MKKWSDKSAPLVIYAEAYKETNAMREVGIEILASTVGANPILIQQKVDGEFCIVELDNNKITLANAYGTLRQEITPLTAEMERIFASRGVKHFIGAGELYAVGQSGERLFLNVVEHIIKSPSTPEEESRIRLALFEAIESDHKAIDGKYHERMIWLNKLLGDEPKSFHAVFSTAGDANVAQQLWKDKVLGDPKWEGLVIRTDGSIKVKYISTIDAIIIGGYPGSGKFANTLGSLMCGLMDKDGNIIHICDVGTGLSNAERYDYWKWILQNTTRETAEGFRFVKPMRVVEVAYTWTTSHPNRAFKWDGNQWTEQQPIVGAYLQGPPRYKRYRFDKGFTAHDVRDTQIPMSGRVAQEQITTKKFILDKKFDEIRNRIAKMQAKKNPTCFSKEQALAEMEKMRAEGIDAIITYDQKHDCWKVDVKGEEIEWKVSPEQMDLVMKSPKHKQMFEALAGSPSGLVRGMAKSIAYGQYTEDMASVGYNPDNPASAPERLADIFISTHDAIRLDYWRAGKPIESYKMMERDKIDDLFSKALLWKEAPLWQSVEWLMGGLIRAQGLPNANHRTSLQFVETILRDNGIAFHLTVEQSVRLVKYSKACFRLDLGKFDTECHIKNIHKWLMEVVDIQSGTWSMNSRVMFLLMVCLKDSGSPNTFASSTDIIDSDRFESINTFPNPQPAHKTIHAITYRCIPDKCEIGLCRPEKPQHNRWRHPWEDNNPKQDGMKILGKVIVQSNGIDDYDRSVETLSYEHYSTAKPSKLIGELESIEHLSPGSKIMSKEGKRVEEWLPPERTLLYTNKEGNRLFLIGRQTLDNPACLTKEGLLKKVEGKDVLVMFYSPTCPHCCEMREWIDDVGIEIIQINADKCGNLSDDFRIYALPFFVLYKNGKESKKKTGSLTKNELRKWVG